ncbi:DUF1364 domain-containing protein [Pseudomonas nitroreducens]|uniref:DUF1364 domain-containing protein n=1 Tax=Pseudomonas nitroreducens TaxID=46680 RepID=UPI003D2AF435
MKLVSQSLRKSARGRECTVRIPGHCNHNPETVVLAHLPCGSKGIGMKGHDQMAVFSCSSCHDVLDGRTPGEVDWKDILRALDETQTIWIQEGLMTIKGAA